MAESEGFEPSKALLALYTLSRRAPSTDSASSPVAIYLAYSSEIKKPSGGGGGIRTHGAGAARTTVFKTVAFNRSATPPSRIARTRIA